MFDVKTEFHDRVTQQIVTFLIEIGLEVRAETIEQKTFMPGILIRDGSLIVDESQLTYPGDLLHEAGHLAVVSAEKRARMDFDAGIAPSEEMAAIAWSWAALRQIGLPPEAVFHADGYKGDSQTLIDALSNTGGPGVPALAWLGMSGDPNAGPDAVTDLPLFPIMRHWLNPSKLDRFAAAAAPLTVDG